MCTIIPTAMVKTEFQHFCAEVRKNPALAFVSDGCLSVVQGDMVIETPSFCEEACLDFCTGTRLTNSIKPEEEYLK